MDATPACLRPRGDVAGPDAPLRRGPVGVDIGDDDARLARAVYLGGRRKRHAIASFEEEPCESASACACLSSGRAPSVTLTVCGEPLRMIVSSASFFGPSAAIFRAKSSQSATDSPLTEATTSPSLRPAAAAGESFSTFPTIAPLASLRPRLSAMSCVIGRGHTPR